MFGTVIIDAYKKEEREELALAIDDICSPNDNYGWASAGIYCFWDYYSEEVLYIGLASDLSDRFKQHNGINPVTESSCKFEKIEAYFENNYRLGYTIFVQSPLSQPLTHRNKATYQKFATQLNAPVEDMLSEQGRNDIKRTEGILIEAYRRKHGRFPPWNDVGGSILGQQSVMPNNYNIVKSFCTPDEFYKNPIISRSTIRELSNNPTYASFENYLHAVRMYILIFGMDYKDALDFANKHDDFGWYQRILEAGYNLKRLIV
ncbi:MAG TPA: hypothetical protein PK566_15525 [Pseudobacteroides sp.]|nr:hypothetical protein [Pseudobacteroides sp.]